MDFISFSFLGDQVIKMHFLSSHTHTFNYVSVKDTYIYIQKELKYTRTCSTFDCVLINWGSLVILINCFYNNLQIKFAIS